MSQSINDDDDFGYHNTEKVMRLEGLPDGMTEDPDIGVCPLSEWDVVKEIPC